VQLVETLLYKPVRSPIVSLKFFIYIILPVLLVSNRNEYQDYFLEGKGGRCIGLTTLTFMCRYS